MDNMFIFNQVKTTPKTAQKIIEGGRLSGYTDINPMWRIKKLTEVFGACGVGWKYEVINRQVIDGSTHSYEKGKGETYRVEECVEKCVFIDILLFYKTDKGEWSDGVFGTGGANFVTAEKYAPYVDNDCWKKALTDAIGNACKNLGMSADIYFSKDDNSKYEVGEEDDDAFKKTVTKQESMKIVNAAREKWGSQAAEKCAEILEKKYGVKSTLEVLQIYLPNVLEDIKDAD
jgi:hypothetical protein